MMLGWLFDCDSFVTRDGCGDWGTTLPIVYQAANTLISVAYLVIPVFLLSLYRSRRSSLPSAYMLVCFAVFILACGFGHFLNTLAFYYPAYRAYTFWDTFTAIASLVTMVLMVPALKHFKSLPTPEEHRRSIKILELNIQAREAMQRQLEGRNKALNKEADELKQIVERLHNRYVTEQDYKELREQIHRIRNA